MFLSKFKFFIVFFLFLQGISLRGSSAIVTDANQFNAIGKYISFFEDEDGEYDIETILELEESKFTDLGKDYFECPATNSVFWFKFSVQNDSREDLFIQISDLRTWYSDLYKVENGEYKKHEFGTLRNTDRKNIKGKSLIVPLVTAEDTNKTTYYARVENGLPHRHLFLVGNDYIFQQEINTGYTINSIYIGILLAMILYNLFLFYSTKERTYFYYLLFLLSALLVTPFIGGYPWFNGAWVAKNLTIIHIPVFIAQTLFLAKFLKLKEKAIIFYRLAWVMTIILSGILPTLDLFEVIDFTILISVFQVLVFVFYTILCVMAIYFWKSGERKARFLVIGWFFLIGSVLVFVLSSNGVLPINVFTTSSIYWGSAIETILFSWGLADYLNILKLDKDVAQSEMLKFLNKQNETLELKVEERTKIIEEEREATEIKNLDLKYAYSKIKQKNKLIIDSINYAKRIQDALLNLESGFKRNFNENYFVLYKPKDIVSGDFYYLAEKEDKIILVVLDCTGHGVPGAFMTMIANSILNQIVHDYNVVEPAKVLSLMSDLLKKSFSGTSNDVNDGMDVSVITIFKKDGKYNKVQFAGAMNPLHYVSNNELLTLKGTKLPISMSKDFLSLYRKESYTQHEIEITEDTNTFYLITDGYQDQFGGPQNKKFMIRNLKKLMLTHYHKPMKEQCSIFENTLKEWQSECKAAQVDDITVLAIKLK